MTEITPDKLRAAVLRAADLGPEYEEGDEADTHILFDDSNVFHILGCPVTGEAILIGFRPASNGAPRQSLVASTYFVWNPRFTHNYAIHEITPPFGEDGFAFRWRHIAEPAKNNGVSYAWRYGDLIITISVQAQGDPLRPPTARKVGLHLPRPADTCRSRSGGGRPDCPHRMSAHPSH